VQGHLLGRENEIAVLQAGWAAAMQGQPTTCLVHGRAGAGKSYLLDMFRRQLSAPAICVRGSCLESTTSVPYHPWLAVFETVLSHLSQTQPLQLTFAVQEALFRLSPHFAAVVGYEERPVDLGRQSDAPQLLRTLAGLLVETRVPLLIFIDDLQWGDEMSLHLFRALATQLQSQNSPILLIGAYREEEVADNPNLVTLLRELKRQGLRQMLGLHPFTVEEIRQLLPSGWQEPEIVATRIEAVTGGNPLFVTELIETLDTEADYLSPSWPIPSTVQDLVAQRMNRLASGQAQVLEALAIWDNAADMEVLQQLSGRSEDDVASAVDAGLRYHLLRLTPESDFHFFHDLMRQAVTATMGVARRQLLHRRIATYWDSVGQYLPSAEKAQKAGQILHHAVEGNSAQLTLKWSTLAIEQAMQASAFPQAMRFVAQGLEAFERVRLQPDSAGDTAVAYQHVHLLLFKAHLASIVGWTLEERHVIDQEITHCLERNPNAHQQALQKYFQVDLLWDSKQYEQSVMVAKQAYEVFERLDDHVMMARSMHAWGRALNSNGHNLAARDLLEQARLMYVDLGMSYAESSCIDALAWLNINLGHINRARLLLERQLTLPSVQDRNAIKCQIYVTLANAYGLCYVSKDTEHYAQEALRLGEQTNSRSQIARSLTALGTAARLRGEFKLALERYKAGLALSEEISDVWIKGWCLQFIGRVYLHLGQVDEAGHWLLRAHAYRQGSMLQIEISDLHWLARLRLRQGNYEEAQDHIVEAIRLVNRHRGELFVLEQPDLFFCYAEVLQALDCHDEAQEMVEKAYDELMDFASQFENEAEIYNATLAAPIFRPIVRKYQLSR
jgi:tetratricopeptide (TPR) repeat protein